MKLDLRILMLGAAVMLLSACGTGNDEGDSGDSGSENNGEVTEDTAAEDNETTDDSESNEASGDAEDTADNTEDSADDNSDSASNESSSSGIDGSSDTISLDAITTDPSEAISIAEENFDGELTGFELDNDNNTWVYEVSLDTSDEDYELQVSVEDLSIINEYTEQDNNINIESFSYDDAVPYNEAVQTAIDETGGELEGFSLEVDDGQLVYEIELENTDSGDDVDVVINAESGEIIELDD